ncbi:glycosyltransferase involved in cell wall biosynthesis [Variovorax boronicumulans]|uniref:Glycosyltransferase involved in cell wall biosynthesis n=1 Tax=Variovorax boronicumulans TaxID=436515 RepID=A0AAW8D2T4_9BURK|nr:MULTISPECIES: glycosyltransferase [Variovorax]MDP9894176.1 glycosyltransferase involved in cell wall biosynthesis [Variovorax boronicumulans]MDQ0053995.1 glycosyltransferase involved in cell wall biosynthesis [Variovorax boronicumulans]MDQ0606598.1 glycosyltransferase involved in cell wall biosynthesis [Variovorax sp. W1I1]
MLAKLSVCLITYNQKDYVENALDGILMQKTTFPFKVFIHDDASTDGTAEILRRYKEKHGEKIHLIIREENEFSKNGFYFFKDLIERTEGEYLAICEGDDYWIDSSKLEKQVGILQGNEKYSMSIHNALRENVVNGERSSFNKKKLPQEMGVRDVLLRGWFAPTASFVFRKENVVIPKMPGVNMDIVMLYQNATKGIIHYSEGISSVYRYSALGSLSERYRDDRSALYKKKLAFLRYVDRSSKGRYVIYSFLARMKIFAAIVLRALGLR